MQKTKTKPFVRSCSCGKVRASKYAMKTMNEKRKAAFEKQLAECPCDNGA